MQEIARFNILITPEEALEAQERDNGSEDTVEVATPIEVSTEDEDEDDLKPDHDQVDDTDGEDQDPEDQDKDKNEKATKLAQSLLEEAKVKLAEGNLVLAEVDTDEPYSDIPF
jgi:hypothetical protein